MQFGVVFPQTEFGNDPLAIRDYAQAVEGLGYGHIVTYDHILGANPKRAQPWTGPYTYQDAFHEPFVLFAYMAAVTERVQFTTGILVLPQRQTALVAKQAAELDVLSGGRLRLGIGIGWNWVEYIALDQDFRKRGKRSAEQVRLLRQLWTEPLVRFEGRWDVIPDAGINPLPVQRPIPIWFGGHADPVLRRVAELGDGWMPGYRTAEQAAPALAKLERYLAETGRSRDELGLEPRLVYGDGDRQSWQATVEGWQAAGATHLALNTMRCGFDTPDKHLAAIRAFAGEMGLGA
jgi:probable F420-dependent oxidoreductase